MRRAGAVRARTEGGGMPLGGEEARMESTLEPEQETQHMQMVLGDTVKQAVALTGNVLLLGWFLWTLPFRIGVKAGMYLLIRMAARPIDFAQRQAFGREYVQVETLVRNLKDLVKPLWNSVFPFAKAGEGRSQATSIQVPQFIPVQTRQQAPKSQGLAGETEYARAPLREEPAFPYEAPGAVSEGSEPDLFAATPGVAAFSSSRNQRSDQRRGRGARFSGFDDESSRGEGDFGEEDEGSQQSFESEPSARLPKSTNKLTAAEVDRAVMLAIEAKQTHNVVEKLFWIAVVLMVIVGMVLVRIDFTRSWTTTKSADGKREPGKVEPAIGFEGVYGILVVLTIAFRSDFPFNLGVLFLVVFFSGVVFGTIIARAAFSS